MGRVFANDLGHRRSILDRVRAKTQKIVLDNFLLNTQQYKVHIKSKVEQSRERNCALPFTSMWYLLKRELSSSLRLRSPSLFLLTNSFVIMNEGRLKSSKPPSDFRSVAHLSLLEGPPRYRNCDGNWN